MARSKHSEMKKTKIEIIPMIDTMFFLLVFFILSSLGIIKLQGIKIDLPSASNSTEPPKGPKPIEILIVIDAKKNITVNGVPATGQNADIGPILQREISKLGPNPDMNLADVVISADPAAPEGTVVTCIDQARKVNIKNFAIATVASQDNAGASNTTTPNNAPPAAGTKP